VFKLIGKAPDWSLAAFGKHPVAGDYLSLGRVTPLLKGFSSWLDAGYDLVRANARDRRGFWRFWAKGPNSKLICGILKDSRDCHGRAYPLMMAGEGRLPDAGKDWDLLPFACDPTWQALATLGDESSPSITHLSHRLLGIDGPASHWETCRSQWEAARNHGILPGKPALHSDFINKMNNIDGLSRRDHFSVRIDVGRPEDTLIPVTKLLALLKTRSKIEPATVFIGGRDDDRRLMVMKRSLTTQDFKRLWETGAAEDHA
jgi:type VI secretion system protein VasJ